MDLDEERDSDFLHHYQVTRFKSNPADPYVTRDSKMQCMILAYLQTCLKNSNYTTCLVLRDMMKDYAELVDDRNGINNSAEATLSLLGNTRIGNKSFESGLPEDIPDVEKLLNPLPGDCRHLNESCSRGEPTSDEITATFLPPTSISPKKKLSDKCHISVQKKLLPIEMKTNDAPKFPKSLYSTYNGTSSGDLNGSDLSEFCKVSTVDLSENKYKKPQKGFKRSFLDQRVYETEKETVSGRRFNKNTGNRQFNEESFNNDTSQNKSQFPTFRTAGEQLKVNQVKNRSGNSKQENPAPVSAPIKKSLGGKSRIVSNRFVPPMKNNDSQEDRFSRSDMNSEYNNEEVDERLKLIDPKMVELIRSEIMDSGTKIDWDDIAGLHFAKNTIQEIVVWPMLRPDIFTGLRRPPKGILLFGPPGTGKTLIGKCIASQSSSTFFSISASSLTSKWIGDGEKMVRALFAVARCHQPAVVFIDEIDSLLSQRSDTEHESSRRIKTEFLVQLDGAATGEEDRILVIGATNRPQELDEAARRRLVKRLYIPLPDREARRQLVENLMRSERNELSVDQIEEISDLTDGYSGADMKNLCQEACLGPIRSIAASQMFHISAENVRPVNIEDFKSALRRVRSSVSGKDLEIYKAWDEQYGSGGVPIL